MATVVIDQTRLETREKKNYWDRESVESVFGEDAEEELMDDTDGMGWGRLMPDGSVGIMNRKEQRIERVDPDRFLDGPEVEDDGSGPITHGSPLDPEILD